MKKKILITRGVHPYEISAFYLAPKVADRLRVAGVDVTLLRFPYDKTHLYAAIKRARGEVPVLNDGVGYAYFEAIKLPRHSLHVDFHNSRLDVPGAEKIRKKPLEEYSVGVNTGDIEFLSGHLRRRTSYCLEIPAFWKPMPEWIQGPPYSHMVDFRKTAEQGLVGDTMVDKLAAGF